MSPEKVDQLQFERRHFIALNCIYITNSATTTIRSIIPGKNTSLTLMAPCPRFDSSILCKIVIALPIYHIGVVTDLFLAYINVGLDETSTLVHLIIWFDDPLQLGYSKPIMMHRPPLA